jgi:biotin carboxyl carrier protein
LEPRWQAGTDGNRRLAEGSLLREYDIVIDGRSYKVELVTHEEGAPFLVKVNDRPREVEIVNKVSTTEPFSVKMSEKVYRVKLERVGRKEPFAVDVNDSTFKVYFRRRPRKVTATVAPSSSPVVAAKPMPKTIEEGAVVAPMAGKIVSVRVDKGDAVKAGTVICVLEAMKMENEIAATNSGLVQEVRVSEGMAVNEGDVLLVIK